MIDFTPLEQNVFDVIQEEQIKLGYRRETVRLYYPLLSLNRFLNREYTVEEMKKSLSRFCCQQEEKMGRIQISHQGERFCFCLPPEASEYIHQHTEEKGFLREFIETVSGHHVSLEEVFAVFHRYSSCVIIQKMSHGEFDYLVYFQDGNPDSFRYCLTQEGEHIIYHRFTPADYQDFSFGE